MPNEPIKSIPITSEIHIQKVVSVKPSYGLQRRSTLNETNALIFKAEFDKIIASNYTIELLIPWDCLDVTPATMYIKIIDARRWLAMQEINPDGSQIEDGPYHKLCKLYNFKRMQSGIGIVKNNKALRLASSKLYSSGTATGIGIKASSVIDSVTGVKLPEQKKPAAAEGIILGESQPISNWKDKIVDIYENGEFGKTFIVELEVITPEVELWIEALFSGASEFGIGYLIEGNTIKIMKESLQ